MSRIGRNNAGDDPFLRDGWSVESSSGDWPTLMSPNRTEVFNIERAGYGYGGERENVFKDLINENSKSGIYELRIRSIDGETRVVYLGRTNDLGRRLLTYSKTGSHQPHNINLTLKRGDSIEYRYRPTNDYIKEEKYLLDRYRYDFNVMDQGAGASWHPIRHTRSYINTMRDYFDKKQNIIKEMKRRNKLEMEKSFGRASDENPEGCELMTERFDGMMDPLENCRLMEQLFEGTTQHFDSIDNKLEGMKNRLRSKPSVRAKRPRDIGDADESGVDLEEAADGLSEMGGVVDDLLPVLEFLAVL